MEKLPVAAYVCDAGGLITYFNPLARNAWGRALLLNDPVDRFCGSFRMFDAAGVPIVHADCWMAMALRTGEAVGPSEIVIERPDGQRVTALAHVSPLFHPDGALAGAVNVVIEVGDIKYTEHALAEADRARNAFLATLAHELRNPLAPLRSAVSILRLKLPDERDVQDTLGIMERQLRQMTRLIDDLLDIARITRNALELRKEPVELAAVIASCVENSRPVIESFGHTLSVDLTPEPITLDADPTRLAQALSNLLDNAARYTEPGGRIHVRAERQGSDVVVTVTDSGIGLPAHALPHVFDGFTSEAQTNGRSPHGLGIGLLLVRQLVELHGGTVSAHSDGVDRGCVFTIRLPLVVPSDGVAGAPAQSVTPDRLRSRARILVVDDNIDAASTLATLLQLAGGEVRVSHDGAEAIDVAGTFRPDVVLLDLGLPRIDGFETARRLRALPWGRHLTLIAITGWGQVEDRDRTRAAGFDHHLVKPVDSDQLLDLVARGASPPVRGLRKSA